MISLLDEPTSVPGWKWHANSEPGIPVQQATSTASNVEAKTETPLKGKYDPPVLSFAYQTFHAVSDPSDFLSRVKTACQALITAEPEITRQDQIAGDGDAGLTLKAGAEGDCCTRSSPSKLIVYIYDWDRRIGRH